MVLRETSFVDDDPRDSETSPGEFVTGDYVVASRSGVHSLPRIVSCGGSRSCRGWPSLHQPVCV